MERKELLSLGAKFIDNNESLAAMRARLCLDCDTPEHNNESIVRIGVDTHCCRLEIVRDHGRGITEYHVEKPLADCPDNGAIA